jgi:hypothetical protein
VVFFLRAFPPKPCTLFSPLPCVLHAPPAAFALTIPHTRLLNHVASHTHDLTVCFSIDLNTMRDSSVLLLSTIAFISVTNQINLQALKNDGRRCNSVHVRIHSCSDPVFIKVRKDFLTSISQAHPTHKSLDMEHLRSNYPRLQSPVVAQHVTFIYVRKHRYDSLCQWRPVTAKWLYTFLTVSFKVQENCVGRGSHSDEHVGVVLDCDAMRLQDIHNPKKQHGRHLLTVIVLTDWSI